VSVVDVPPGSAVITPAEVYREVQAIHQGVTEMRGELREVMRVIPDHEERLRALEQRDDGDDIARDVQDHETRLRSMERRIWLAAGVAAGAAAGLTKAISAVLGG
jgi:hypothetical protein